MSVNRGCLYKPVYGPRVFNVSLLTSLSYDNLILASLWMFWLLVRIQLICTQNNKRVALVCLVKSSNCHDKRMIENVQL